MEQSNVLHPGQSQNDVQPQAPLHMSKLNLSNRFGTGMRFGQLSVCECLDGDGKDTIPLVSAHTVRSHTLTSQLLSDVYLKKDWFQVPKRAILPNNWDKVYEQPPIGDDVTQDVGTSVSDFTSQVSRILAPSSSDFTLDLTDPVAFFRWMTVLQYFYSYGSLISALGYSFERFFSFPSDVATILTGSDIWNCDKFVDEVYTYLAQNFSGAKYFSATIGGKTYSVYFGIVPGIYGPNRISFRRFLELIHDDPSALTVISSGSSNLSTLISNLSGDCTLVTISSDGSSFDLAYPSAYQLVCAHFYSNDSIDYVYSADLYRQVVGDIVRDLLDNYGSYSTDMFFTYNGINTEYDYLSARVFNIIVNETATQMDYAYFFRYVGVMFAWRQSLRFMDYFSGAKSRPLSIGNTNVAVVGNNVNVIDIIAKSAAARFFNFSNRARRKIEGWMEDLFHVKPSHDWHNPLYLGHIQDTIYAVETENTGDTQLVYDPNSGNYSGAPNSTTSQFKSNAERFAFEVELKEASVVIGIEYFDIPRMYSHATRRMFFHEDRFDMFNPFMQTIGDQALYLRELTDNLQGQTYDFPFGYKYRHAEYKQSFDRCKGPFASGLLSSWVFSDDTPARGEDYVISPDFIRSSCSELDRFYLSLTHYSLANYFHFLVVNYNGIEAVRNMIVAPTLL